MTREGQRKGSRASHTQGPRDEEEELVLQFEGVDSKRVSGKQGDAKKKEENAMIFVRRTVAQQLLSNNCGHVGYLVT